MISKVKFIFAAILTTISLAQGLLTLKDSQRCGDWKAYKDEKCFKLVDRAGLQSQDDAEVICESFSEELKRESFPKLATVKTQEEQDFLHQMLFVDANSVDNVWLGLKEVGKSGVFEWNDGSPVEYSNWANQNVSDEDHHCVQMTSGKGISSAGQWVRVHCAKRNEVLCERTQTWSLETLQNMFLNNKLEMEREIASLKQEHEQQIKSLKEENERKLEALNEKMQQRSVPTGFVYVQLADQLPPTTLWPHTNWTDITPLYAGLFFRAVGGNSAPFGQIQDENTKRLEQIQFVLNGTANYPVTVPLDGTWSPTIHTGTFNEGYKYIYTWKFHLSKGEVRPRNQAVRIWQRNYHE